MQFRRETAQIALLTWGEGDSGIRSTNSGGTKKLLNQKSTNNHMYLCIYLAYIYIYKLVHYIHTCISIYVTSLLTVIELAKTVPHCTVIFLGCLTATQTWYHGICFEIHPRDMTTGTVKLTQQGRVPGKVKKTWTMSHTPEGDQSTGVYTSAKADNYRSIFTKFGVATVEFHVKASNLCPPATIKHQNASPIFFILFFRKF